MSTATSTRAMKHYEQAIHALSEGQYGDLTEQERQSLLRVLRTERQRLLHEETPAGSDDAGTVPVPCRPAS
jgi:hypothetical protein